MKNKSNDINYLQNQKENFNNQLMHNRLKQDEIHDHFKLTTFMSVIVIAFLTFISIKYIPLVASSDAYEFIIGCFNVLCALFAITGVVPLVKLSMRELKVLKRTKEEEKDIELKLKELGKELEKKLETSSQINSCEVKRNSKEDKIRELKNYRNIVLKSKNEVYHNVRVNKVSSSQKKDNIKIKKLKK